MKKRTFQKIPALLLALVLLLGLLPVGIFADSVRTLEEDGVGGYYLNMPATGTDTLDISDKSAGFSFTLYDNGGAGADYSVDCNGYLVITAPAGTVLTVAGSGTAELYNGDKCDYLTLYDGDTSSVIGEEKYGGSNFTVSDVFTTGNVLKVYFCSDYAVNKEGFELTVTVVDASSYATLTFTYDGVSSTKKVPTGAYVMPAFSSMFTLPTGKSFSHWQGGEGSYEEGDAYTVTGDAGFAAVLTDNIITLSSDGEGGYYANMPTTGSYSLDLSDKSAGFTFTLYDEGGAETDYSENCNAELLITAPSGTVLSFSGAGALEQGEYDYLFFFDGDTDEILGDDGYFENFAIAGLMTTGNALKVWFYSDYMVGSSGFALNVTVADPSSLAELIFVYGEETETVTVPAGAAYALPPFEGVFTLPDRKILVGWQIGEDLYAAGDSITPTDGLTITAVLGDEPDLLSDGAGGWYAKVPVSGGVAIDLSDKTPGFALKVYDNGGPDAAYADGCNGYLLLSAPAGYLFTVSGGGATHANDYLRLYEGDSETLLGANGYYGNYTIDELIPAGNELKISFVSDATNHYDGFELLVRIVDPSALATVTLTSAGISKNVTATIGEDYVLPAYTDYFTLQTGASFIGWEYGGTTYDEGDTVTVTGDMTITAVVDYGEVLRSDGEGGYYALMPASGSVELDLSDKSAGFAFTVYDDGGPGGNYSNNCNGYLRIIAPAGTILSLSGSGTSESVSWDWLSFYDGDTSKVLGNAKYGGDGYVVSELQTTGNMLIVYFKSDNSQNYEGFALTVTILDASNLAMVTFVCGEETKVVNAQKGESYTLPEFTDLFTLSDGQTFTGWENGGNSYTAGFSYTITEDMTFTAAFQTEPDLISDGNGGWYTRFFKTTDREIDLSDKSAGFTVKVYDNGGPDGQYSNDCNSYLTFIAPEGMILSVCGGGSAESASWDWLTIYDGDTSTVLGDAKYSGNNFIVPVMQTTGNVLILYFKSDYMTVKDGFELTVMVLDPENISTLTFVYGEETREIHAASGEEYSLPGFASFFSLPEGMIFTGWLIGDDVYAAGDSFDVTGDATFTAILEEEPDLIPDGQGGFYAKVPTTDMRYVDISDRSSGFVLKVYDAGGPNGAYSNNSSGYLQITAPEGATLTVSGYGKGESTSYDWLTFYDGDISTVLGNSKYGGNSYAIPELQTTGSVLIIWFRTDDSAVYDGFELTVKIVGAPICYDLNGDHTANITDVTTLLDALSNGSTDEKYDLNGDKSNNITDVTALLDFLTGGCSHEATVEVEEIEATCYDSGVSEGSYCAICGAILWGMEEIPATGHNFIGGMCEFCGETVSPGDVTKFGRYEQDNDEGNGAEDIEWIVLTAEDGRALLLSKYALFATSFHYSDSDEMTWAHSSLRSELNNEFYSNAFDVDEQNMLVLSSLFTLDNPEFGTDGGEDTFDYVFLLSYDEATNGNYGFISDEGPDYARVCRPTEYALANGGTADENGYIDWWLRTMGLTGYSVVTVGFDGEIWLVGGSSIDETTTGVRPAIWIMIE